MLTALTLQKNMYHMNLAFHSFRKKIALAWGCVAVLGTLTGLVTDAFSAVGLFSDNSGNLEISYKGEKVVGEGERHIVVCLDSIGSASMLNGIYPSFSNNTRYGLNNFSIRYLIESSNVMFEPTDYYTFTQEGEGSYNMKYKETILPAFSSVERPVRKFFVAENGGKMHLKAQASYDGIEKPITYNLYTSFFVIPFNAKTFSEWKQLCKKSFLPSISDLNVCDIYYISRQNGQEQEINCSLTAMAQPKQVNGKSSINTLKDKKNPAVVEKKQLENDNTNISINIKEVNDEYKINVKTSEADTTLLLLALLEDTVSHNRRNELYNIEVKSTHLEHYVKRKKNEVLLEYEICRLNNAVRDSVLYENGDELQLNNLTLRTIGILAKNDTTKYYNCYFVKPWESEGNKRIKIKDYNIFSFYELPERLLVDEFKPIDKNHWMKTAIKYGNWTGIFALFFVLFIIVEDFVSECWDRKKVSLSILLDTMKDSADESNRKVLIKVISLLLLFYVGSLILVFISYWIVHTFPKLALFFYNL